MSLTDPTAGLGYSFGARLPSADINTVFTQQVRALDVVQGGSYTLTGNIVLSQSGSPTWTSHVATVYDNSLTVSGADFNLDTGGFVMDAAAFVQYSPARTHYSYCNTPSSVVTFASTVVSGGGALDWTLGASIGSGVAPTSCAVVQQQVDAANSNFAVIDFDLTSFITRGTIEGVQVYIDPAGAGSNPQSMPQMSLWKRDDQGTETQIGTTKTDASGSYRTAHYVVLDVSTAVSGNAYQYNPSSTGETLFLRFRGENGTNAAAGLVLHSIVVEQELSIIL